MINKNIADDDIVCVGEEKDILGIYERQIVGVEKRKVGFDVENTYKAITTKPFELSGAMKFWKK